MKSSIWEQFQVFFGFSLHGTGKCHLFLQHLVISLRVYTKFLLFASFVFFFDFSLRYNCLMYIFLRYP